MLRCFIIGLSFLFFNCENKTHQVDENTNLKINEIQYIGTHNSYKKAIPEELLEQIKQENLEMANSLDYSHPTIWMQLDAGLRLLELDIYHDPEGGRFSNPLGKELVAPENWDAGFDLPGFKVFHVQDIDFLSHHALFRDYLSDLKNWSLLHPNHLPIFISINAKDANFPDRGFATALPFDQSVFSLVDKEIEDFLGVEKLIKPKDVRGSFKDLRTAIIESGWPELSSSQGKFIFILDEREPKVAEYLSNSKEGNEGHMFVTVPEDHPMSAIHIINDPIQNQKQIKALVEKGFIVRTRADAGTKEARANTTERREMAFSSGAQLISTDYYVADPRWEGAYAVQFEGGKYSRINPLFPSEMEENIALSEEVKPVIALDPETFTIAKEQMKGLVLDVRTSEEVKHGVISGAINMDFLQEDFSNRITELDKNETILVYCKVGGRSGKAADLLVKNGFKHVYHLEGGYDRWKNSGFPVDE
tara:strand:- start:6409 stop:7836 length:1428 start_codon:yes stop_codon:yes gene_type:complete